MKKYKRIICLMILNLLLLSFLSISYGFSTGDYSGIYTPGGETTLVDAGGAILGVVQVIAVAFGIISALIMGMKYMFSSVESRATIKQKMIIFVIGSILVFGATGIIRLIANWANQVIK